MTFGKSFENQSSYLDTEEAKLAKQLENLEFPSLEMAYDESRRIIEIQVERIDTADTKASVLVGFSGVILAAIFGGLESFLNTSPNTITIVSFSLSAVFTALSAATGLYAYRLNPDFYISPSPRTLQNRYILWQEKHVRYLFLGQLTDVTEKNHALLTKKLRWIANSLVFMLIGIVLLAVSSVAGLF